MRGVARVSEIYRAATAHTSSSGLALSLPLHLPRALSAALDERRVDEHEVRRRDAEEAVLEAVEPAARRAPVAEHVAAAPNLGDGRALRVADDAAAVVDERD